MNKNERKTMVACMDFIARNLNDECDFLAWLQLGVADGDISYERMLFDINEEIESVDEYYISDEIFADTMHTFLRVMRSASKAAGGGLYCDGIIDKKC